MFLAISKILFITTFLHCSVWANESLAGMRKFKETIARTSIITYRKADVSKEDIHRFYDTLKEDSSLSVEHLPHLGAFVVTFNSMDRMAGRKRSLMTLVEEYKMDFNEDEYVSHPEDPSMRDDIDDQVPPPDDDNPIPIEDRSLRDGDQIPPPDDDNPTPIVDRSFVQTIPPNDKRFHQMTNYSMINGHYKS